MLSILLINPRDSALIANHSGKHNGEWDQCVDCHLNQSDFSEFSCIDCHEHNQTDADNDHDEVQNYVYASWACYDCHPDGENKMIIPKIESIKGFEIK